MWNRVHSGGLHEEAQAGRMSKQRVDGEWEEGVQGSQSSMSKGAEMGTRRGIGGGEESAQEGVT